LGMSERLGVEVPCGACRRQPRAGGSCMSGKKRLRARSRKDSIPASARSCGMEARGKPQHRMQVNLPAGWPEQGECAPSHDARYPTVARTVLEAGAAGHCSFLPPEISTSPRECGRAFGSNDVRPMPVEKSDHLVVVLKPGNAGGAKGVAG
jgi:hypothetical protein